MRGSVWQIRCAGLKGEYQFCFRVFHDFRCARQPGVLLLNSVMLRVILTMAEILRLSCAVEIAPALPNAHSHNDYEHKRPLLDALANGFTSVEADIYLVEGLLLVAHDRKDVDRRKTLEG